MRAFFFICLATFATLIAVGMLPARAETTRPLPGAEAALAKQGALKSAVSFNGIADRNARSLALYAEAAKVITHPRCVNCHPADNIPRQGAMARIHSPPMNGAADGFGPTGQKCGTCHGVKNFEATGGDYIQSIPGNPKWALAPSKMAWQGKSLGDICRQIKDPSRNGGKDLEALYHHMNEDELVAWGWNPGKGRAPAPGDQKTFGGLIRAWIDTGAACPA